MRNADRVGKPESPGGEPDFAPSSETPGGYVWQAADERTEAKSVRHTASGVCEKLSSTGLTRLQRHASSAISGSFCGDGARPILRARRYSVFKPLAPSARC